MPPATDIACNRLDGAMKPWNPGLLAGRLQDEHALIREALGLFEAWIDRPTYCPGPIATLIRFCRDFVEQSHHELETSLLYPIAALHGSGEACEVVGELLAEHEESKTLLHTLSLFWEPGSLSDDEWRGFQGVARTYLARLRRHMEAEEAELFGFAAEVSPEEARIRCAALDAADEAASRLRLDGWRRELVHLARGAFCYAADGG